MDHYGRIETELKLQVQDSFLLDELWRASRFGDWQVLDRRRERQRNVYYDTADGALKARGASLRWRTKLGERNGELTLKFRRQRSGCIFRCGELTRVCSVGPDPEVQALLARAARVAGGQLSPILALETDRRSLLLARATGRIEVALDQVTLPGLDFFEYEVEAELLQGTEGDLLNIQELLLATGRTWPVRHGKRGRALRYLKAVDSKPLLCGGGTVSTRLPA